MDKATAEAKLLDETVSIITPSAIAVTTPGRPGIDDVADDLSALHLSGGPADRPAFHDFHVLKMAFRDVWVRALNRALYSDVVKLYEEFTALYEFAGKRAPVFGPIKDLDELQSFLGTADAVLAQFVEPQLCPDVVTLAFPEAPAVWKYINAEQIGQLATFADIVVNATDEVAIDQARSAAREIIELAKQRLGRLSSLLIGIQQALAEPYAFDVFAPNTYNFGVMLTYRQRWEPLSYQAGDLVATIPLAPGESRKFSKRRVVKKVRAEREIERSMRSHAEQAAETGRAESEIMKKAASATNFKLSASGSFNVGIGSISASSEFSGNGAQESASVKKHFHEQTVKAAQEFRLERSIEVDTTSTDEAEATESGEITNPNNEIAVTYLFYELQRRYSVHERIHRARPVILIAQDVPAPHEIDEAWLIAHQWILSRVLLDESLRPALEYLSVGFTGDEIAAATVRQNFETQRGLVRKLEGEVAAGIAMRDSLREYLVRTALKEALVSSTSTPMAVKVLTLGMAPDPGEDEAARLSALEESGRTRLQYAEQSLADAQAKLKAASDAMAQATRELTEALRRKTTNHVKIDQLRIHVKDNIFYYMQAIWDQEVPDQRFFRLYDIKVRQPTYAAASTFSAAPAPIASLVSSVINLGITPSFDMGAEVSLSEVADLDTPLGYKGNYIIFPLKKNCDLTDFMLLEFVDDYFGVGDPDRAGEFTIKELEEQLAAILADPQVSAAKKNQAKRIFLDRLQQARPVSDEIIVPTGQLFIEALPGHHPLLEDFKLRHRREDLHKVQADVRRADLENIRLAARLVDGQLEDPDVEKRIVVDAGVPVVGDT